MIGLGLTGVEMKKLNTEKLGRLSDENQNIYINIDHLKKGSYTINILLNNKIIKSFKVSKL